MTYYLEQDVVDGLRKYRRRGDYEKIAAKAKEQKVFVHIRPDVHDITIKQICCGNRAAKKDLLTLIARFYFERRREAEEANQEVREIFLAAA